MATPIQVVLQAGDFVTEYTRPPGGSKKDVFKDRDDEFREHRDQLVRQVRSLARSTRTFNRSSVSVVAVTLASAALAKSNRPKSLFVPHNLPPMGTARSAELLLQVTPDALSDLAEKIADAPVTVPLREKLNKKTGEIKLEPNPSQLRCDVGAIDTIRLWDEGRRLSVSIDQMIAWFKQPGTPLGLVVRLFKFVGSNGHAAWTRERRELTRTLETMGCALEQDAIGEESARQVVLIVRWNGPQEQGSRGVSSLDDWLRMLPQVTGQLCDSPIVRSIHVPARIRTNAVSGRAAPAPGEAPIPNRAASASYPVVGVIDGGVCQSLANWIEPSPAFLLPSDGDPKHGTGIAGLLVMGQALNGTTVCPEPDGCVVVDICLIPREGHNVFLKYYSDAGELFRRIEAAVVKAKRDLGARVFNFSLNLEHPPVDEDDYCYETQCMDRIAWKHDVVFVVSAGNLPDGNHRPEWPADQVQALSVLARRLRVSDGIRAPADSMANVSVAAVNTPIDGFIPEALAPYSCRGPSIFGGLKPDLAHFGGCANKPSGLTSVARGGTLASVMGTSYAAPLVAKTLARYVHLIGGSLSRELLIGLAIHHSRIPDVFSISPISDHAKDLIGFGIPLPAEPSILGKSSSITLVFESVIPKGKRLDFRFAWPRSLTDQNGRCRGRGRLTLVARPSVDGSDGEEFARTQLDAHLHQLDRGGTRKGGVFSIGLPESIKGKNSKLRESVLRRHQLKWGPVKVYEYESKDGKGESSQWRLTIEALERKEDEIPSSGLRFAAILTIEDIDGRESVFDDLRQSLTSQSVQLTDIRIVNRARARRGR